MCKKYQVKICCFFIILSFFSGCITKKYDTINDIDPKDVFVKCAELNQNKIWKPDGLKVELMEVPLGINSHNPAFSWNVNGIKNQVYQDKYQIVISKSKNLLEKQKYILDTGWCRSSENTYVKIKDIDKYLEDNSVYYWKVRLEDTDGNISEFSDSMMFSTAVGSEWEGLDGIWTSNGSWYAFLRTEFMIEMEDFSNKKNRNNSDKYIERALLSITALSPEETKQYVYNLYLNGNCIGVGPSRQKGKKINYNVYDVTDMLSEKNVVGIIGYSNTEQSVLCQLTLHYSDGEKEIIFNSGENKELWRALDGDLVYGRNEQMIGTSYYIANAENIDATIYPDGWLEYEFVDDKWEVPIVTNKFSKSELYCFASENMQRFLKKPEVVEKKPEHYFVDMGKEIIGGIRLDIDNNTNHSQEIILRFGEELKENGEVKYQMITGNTYEEKWILKPGHNELENLGMKTFRYLDLYCNDLPIDEKSIYGLALRQNFNEEESDFSSSSTLLNEIYELSKYTVKATNQNLYVDSQSRERNAYEGDVWINMLASYAVSDDYTLARLSNEYLLECRTWPAEYPLYAIYCSYRDYMQTGNIDSLEENYQYLKRNIELVPIDGTIGLVRNDYDEEGYNRPLVDWPETERDGFYYDEAEYNTVVNAVACRAYEYMSYISGEMDLDLEAEYYSEAAQTIRESMVRNLYNHEKGAFSDGLDKDYVRIEHYSQHATAYSLYSGVYLDDDMKREMQRYLEKTGKIKMSVFGAYFLLQGLYDSGNGNFANKLLLREDRNDTHTWAYMIRNSCATITTEAWDTKTKDNMTYSHPWGASPSMLITEGIFGIKPIKPGFEEFQIKLQPGEIRSAYIKTPIIKGTIEVSYLLDESFSFQELQLTVPSNTNSVVYVPKEILKVDEVYVDNNYSHLKENEECFIIELSAGGHVISMKQQRDLEN
ncbi:MAG: family 78 glycoside hydrolase catalytic domain [Roseburia sp.]|nr:family 78 glycoside hydrolase catalytic domain [Roseburia sp.]